MARNYWGYRINKNKINFFRSELEQGRLRQGWGWDEKQCLTTLIMDSGAKRNLPIFNKVKKGDILLIPRLPTFNEVAVVEATEDFNTGYRFEIDSDLGDYGHIFPAKLIKQFVRKNESVSGDIRSTLKNVSRFWNLGHCADAIERLIQKEDKELRSKISFTDRFYNILYDSLNLSFDAEKFSNDLYNRLNENLSNEEWEYALVEGLKKIYPSPIVVERTGGILEKQHGTDIIIKFPGLSDYQYAIAIQVKDYSGYMSGYAVKQISKADQYWKNEGLVLIDKYVIVTKCEKEKNAEIASLDDSVKIIFANELKELLMKMGISETGFALDTNN
ncbi:hypothetical protein [Endozoicomonas euniceicola]|uniref:Restriction endonuclease type IV Mrr domain-containing protein n=1 Tax=Endozoicomonas euniceicola TaxID=1234143 RepID=A0ABY6GUE3_9GAMM|nr:hypothetical protein [Endozoicomonas euniceicola]UYM16014.1 hypothetical protein NX720_24935 [Endozoicomonas euniceicola]